MLTQRQALEEARGNIAAGTTIAARLKESSQNPEIRELAKAVHYIGFGSQQIVNAFTDSGRVKDLQKEPADRVHLPQAGDAVRPRRDGIEIRLSDNGTNALRVQNRLAQT